MILALSHKCLFLRDRYVTRVRETEYASLIDLSFLLTGTFGVKAQYLRWITPSVTIPGQNNGLVMGRRI